MARRRLRVPGHKLTMTWSGEYGVESSSTGTCPCGWEESASSQREVRHEYHAHLLKVLARAEAERSGEDYWTVLNQMKDAWYR